MEIISQHEDFPPLTSDVSDKVCPICGGNKRARNEICSKCKADQARERNATSRAARAPQMPLREYRMERPHAPPLGESDEPVTLEQVVGAVQQQTSDGKKVTGWDADDLDLVAYLMAVGVFIGIGWAVTNALEDREYGPRFQECEAFCLPIARMIARRVKVPGMKSGDFKDVLAVLSASAGYGLRCYNITQMKMEERKERQADTRPQHLQISEAVAPPMTTAHNPNTVPPPNGTAPVQTGRAAIPPQMRQAMEQEGKL